MRRYFALLALSLGCCSPFSVRALDAATAAAQFDAANKLYAQNQFPEAMVAYEQILGSGQTSPALSFNFGNACFKAGELGRAIAAYRQAEALTPRDPDVRANLQFARNQVAGPRAVRPAWQRWLGNLSGKEWLWLTTAAVWLAAGLVMARLVKPALRTTLRPWTWGAFAATALLIAETATAHRQNFTAQSAVVITPDVTVRNGPFDESPSTFTVHDGAELLVLDRKDNWFQVTDGGRNVGWIKRDVVIF